MDLHVIFEMVMHKSNSPRFVEIDVLRGLAIIAMVFLHILWDLDYFGVAPLNQKIYRFQIIVPTMFFLLVGISLVISKNRKINRSPEEEKKYNQHLILRGLKIFSLGMIITSITLLFMPDRPIIFGVLHFIGISIILTVPFLKFKSGFLLMFAILILFAGTLFGQYTIENPTALHLAFGIHQANVGAYTIDYFPLIPWFGAVLTGAVLGSLLYKDNKRRFRIPDISKYRPVTMFSWLGKHSLAIYLFHQPVVAGVLSLYLIL